MIQATFGWPFKFKELNNKIKRNKMIPAFKDLPLSDIFEDLIKQAKDASLQEEASLDTSKWEKQHKKKPKGKDSWFFMWKGRAGQDFFEVVGDFEKAKAQAIAKASSAGAKKVELI